MTISKEPTDNSIRFSVALNPTIVARLDAMMTFAGCPTRNAMLVALVATIDYEKARDLYKDALKQGLVKPKTKVDPAKKELMDKLGTLSKEELEKLLEARSG